MAKERQTAIRFEAEQLERVTELAEQEQRTTAAMIRILVGEALEVRKKAGRR